MSADGVAPPAAPGAQPAAGLASAEAAARLARDGPNDVPERKPHALLAFARKFWGLSAWMIELIAALSLVLGKETDLWVALALLLVNAVLGFVQERRASAAVAALRKRLQVTARVLRDGAWRALPAIELVAGDIVRLRSGDFVPADVRVIEGALRLDQSALTGESREIAKGPGDTLYAGSILRQGEAGAVVAATGPRTYFGRTTQLVQAAHPKLHVEEVIARIVKWMFAIVAVPVTATLVVSLLEGIPLAEILPLSLVLLMGAIPVALPVMFTVSMAVGSIELARHGVLVTRLSAAEDAANMDVVCADKTGTLTLNRLSLADVRPEPPFTADDVVRDGAWASHEADRDPIDLAFLRAAAERALTAHGERTVAFVPFSAAARRTEAVVEAGGRRLRVIKGALRTVAAAAGMDPAAVAALEAAADGEARKGYRVLAVARAETEGPLRLVGLAFLHDAPRPDSARLIAELRGLGVGVKMLTGDALPVAREVARELGLGEVVRAPELRTPAGMQAALAGASGGFAEIFPEDKFEIVRALQEAGHVVGMTGDGVNDAPALRQAEVGIAVQSAADVAKGAASVVLTSEGLAGIIDLVKNGRAIYQRLLTWIINKLSRTILKAGLVVIAFLATGKLVISALGMILLVFMTDFAKIALSTDRVRPAPGPETWNLGPLVVLAAILGSVALAEGLGLLAIGWYAFDLADHPGRLQTFTFQTLLYFAVFSIVSLRERRAFWRSRPSAILVAALSFDAGAGLLIGRFGLAELHPLPAQATAAILACTSFCALAVNDVVKVLLARALGIARGTAT